MHNYIIQIKIIDGVGWFNTICFDSKPQYSANPYIEKPFHNIEDAEARFKNQILPDYLKEERSRLRFFLTEAIVLEMDNKKEFTIPVKTLYENKHPFITKEIYIKYEYGNKGSEDLLSHLAGIFHCNIQGGHYNGEGGWIATVYGIQEDIDALRRMITDDHFNDKFSFSLTKDL